MTDHLVTTLADTLAADGVLSLREALAAAQTSAGADTITFDASLLKDGAATISTGSELVIAGGDGIKIVGDVDGDGTADVTLDGGDAHRVVRIDSGTVTMTGVNVANGNAGSNDGGGILVDGDATLTFESATVSDNAAEHGGGIRSLGTLTVDDTTIRDNVANGYGGGLDATGSTAVRNVAILDNQSSAWGGGAVVALGNFENVTVAGNRAQEGGGLWAYNIVARNLTVTGNEAASGAGGGIYFDGSTTLHDSIIVGNTDGTAGDIAHHHGLPSGWSGNLVGTSNHSAAGNTYGVTAAEVFASVNGGAGVAADNGGPVWTVALREDALAAALDVGGVGAPMGDARGFAAKGARDAGAFELGGLPPVPVASEVTVAPASTPEDAAIARTLPVGLFVGGTGALTLTADGGDGIALPSWLDFDAGTLTLSGTPPANFFGDVTVRILATDALGAVAVRTLVHTVAAVNDAPVLRGAEVAARDAGTTEIDLGPLISDVDSTTFRVAVGPDVLDHGDSVTLRSGATVTLGTNNTLGYAPGAGAEALAGAENGVDAQSLVETLDVRVDDGAAFSNSAGFRITVTGDASNDDLVRGGGGRDALFGRGGDDRLEGRGGRDALDGGGGDDLLDGGRGADVLRGGLGNDRLRGGDGEDRVGGGRGEDRLFGGAGDDLLYGHRGDDRLAGGAGNDILWGDAGDDRLAGGAGRDILRGGLGSDELHGRGGRDLLRGGDGDDALSGWRGADRLSGGAGDDVLTGGRGRDTFVFAGAFGTDEVTDWTGGRDVIDLRGAGTALSSVTLRQEGADAVIGIDAGDGRGTIVLQGVDASTLGADNFLF